MLSHLLVPKAEDVLMELGTQVGLTSDWVSPGAHLEPGLFLLFFLCYNNSESFGIPFYKFFFCRDHL